LNENLLKEVMGSEEQVESIRSSHPDAENATQSAAFAVSKHTKSSCIDFLKDCDVEIDTWIDSADESEKVKKALKLFFTVSSSYNKEDWCRFPQILDEETFWAGAKQALQADAQMLGKSMDGNWYRTLLREEPW
jgi:hypothetical protein